MLITKEDCKYLEDAGESATGVSLFRFVDDGTATKEDKQKAAELDEFYFSEIYKEHIIVNYDELK